MKTRVLIRRKQFKSTVDFQIKILWGWVSIVGFELTGFNNRDLLESLERELAEDVCLSHKIPFTNIIIKKC